MTREESEDVLSSCSVQVIVGQQDAPRPSQPHGSWLLAALGGERLGQWPQGLFSPPSLGRYNNQWMIVDYKAFFPGGPSPGRRVLTVLEQIP